MKALFSLVLITAAVGVSTPALAQQKDTLTIGVAAEFENLNPLIGTQAVTNYSNYMTWRPTVALGLDGKKWETFLLKRIPTVENKLVKKKGSGLEVILEILDEAQWGDKTPLTCADFKLTHEIGLHKNVSIGAREAYENIESITWDAAKPKRCTINFKVAKFDYFANLPDPMPNHLERAVFEKFNSKVEGYDHNTLYTKDVTNPGLSLGPYKLQEVKLGSHIMMVENPNWWGKKPAFKKVIVKLVPSSATLVANLRSGNVDMISSAGGLSPDQALIFERDVKASKLPWSVVYVDGQIYGHIDLNLDQVALKDLKVRQALSHLVNRKEIIEAVFEGKAKEAYQNVTDEDPWYVKDIQKYPFSRREAARLLDEAGWKVGATGIREKDGKKLALTVKTAAEAKVNATLLTYLQGQFRSVGIELSIRPEPARVFFSESTRKRDFDMALYSWVSFPESSPRSTLHSGMIPTPQNSFAGQNQPGWKNAEVDKWIDQLEAELDTKKRAELGRKIIRAYAKDIPVIPLYYRQNNSVVPTWMKGFKLSPHKFYETLWVETWSQ